MGHPLDLRVVKVVDTFTHRNHVYHLDYNKSGEFTISKDGLILPGFYFKTERYARKRFNLLKPVLVHRTKFKQTIKRTK